MKSEISKKKESNIKLKCFPTEHSINAYKKGFYFEAVTVLHGYIEVQMKSMFHLSAAQISGANLSITWDVNQKLTYISLTNVLFVLQLINKNEYDILTSFNTMRNELIHRFYSDPYADFYKGISKKKFASSYNQALKLVVEISNRADDLV